jgi:hypothetical protein
VVTFFYIRSTKYEYIHTEHLNDWKHFVQFISEELHVTFFLLQLSLASESIKAVKEAHAASPSLSLRLQ